MDIIVSVIKDIKELDNALKNLKTVTENRDIMTENIGIKNEYRYDDNLVAIDLLKDVTKIIEGIERSDVRDIKNALQNLKDHTTEFEKVFNNFIMNGLYN